MPRTGAVVLAALVALTGIGAGSPLTAATFDVLGPGAERLPDGHYRIHLADGTELMTHGPDPKPDHGGSIGPGDAERAPVCAADYHQHVLYGRPQSAPDRLSGVKASIQSSMRRINAVLNEASVASGDRTADYKVKCDVADQIQVDSFTSTADDFATITSAARAAGYSLSNADYTIFYDAQPGSSCGVGSFRSDERLTASNANNTGGGYAVVFNQCWSNETPMHENGHNQGAVQYSAPYSTGSGAHCWDESDVMCYSPDGGDKHQSGIVDRCANAVHFDCEHDTYFDSAPEEGEYLASSWNVGSPLNRFIQLGPPGDGKPTASLTISCSGMACSFADASSDDGTIVSREWSFGDAETSADADPVHTYAEAGTYLVTLTVTDDENERASASQTLVVPSDGDPDPTTPNLTSGVAKTDRSNAWFEWRYYKIYVPQGRARLLVVLDGPSCVELFCSPDLDLYVRPGHRPDTDAYACRSADRTNDEACTIDVPPGGYYYVGVYSFLSLPITPGVDVASAQYTIRATHQ